MYQSYDKNSDRPETGAKHVKTASFFIKTGFSFVKNRLQRSLSAMLEVLLCLVFASYSAKKVVLYLNDPVLSMVIFAYININIILSAI